MPAELFLRKVEGSSDPPLSHLHFGSPCKITPPLWNGSQFGTIWDRNGALERCPLLTNFMCIPGACVCAELFLDEVLTTPWLGGSQYLNIWISPQKITICWNAEYFWGVVYVTFPKEDQFEFTPPPISLYFHVFDTFPKYPLCYKTR